MSLLNNNKAFQQQGVTWSLFCYRFPCCGKLYPCDTCHNEKETDHEMEMANRMICGYCSKEQVTAQ